MAMLRKFGICEKCNAEMDH